MPKETYHPNAYLLEFRNNRLGLKARSIILNTLEKGGVEAKIIAKQTGLPYSVIMHHLKLLERRLIVRKKGKKPSLWELTGLGQKRLQ